MTRQALLDLAARCEAAIDFETPEAVALVNAIHDLRPEPKCVQPPDYLRSIDAAMSLVPEGWSKNICIGRVSIVTLTDCTQEPTVVPPDYEATAATPALALTAACLKALAQEIEHAD